MSGRSRAILSWVVALVGFMAIVGLASVEFRSRGTQDIGGSTVADYEAKATVENMPVRDFSLPGLDGNTVGPAQFRGSVLVINFWASWCLPCQQEAPGLRWVSNHYEHKGVRFLGVDERDDIASATTFERSYGIRYPSAFDPDGSLAGDYRLVGLPTTFIVDPTGMVRYRFTGYLTRDVLESAVKDMLTRYGP